MPTSPKMCASTNLGNLKWEIDHSTQYTYMYILMNHRIVANPTSDHRLKNRQTFSKSHHFYVICSKYLPPAQTQACGCYTWGAYSKILNHGIFKSGWDMCLRVCHTTHCYRRLFNVTKGQIIEYRSNVRLLFALLTFLLQQYVSENGAKFGELYLQT